MIFAKELLKFAACNLFDRDNFKRNINFLKQSKT